jgi:hypothetical protein
MCDYFLGAIVSKSQLSSHCLIEIGSVYKEFIESLNLSKKLDNYIKFTPINNMKSEPKKNFYHVHIREEVKNLVGRKKLLEIWSCYDFSWYGE